jgi:hypothetical protein
VLPRRVSWLLVIVLACAPAPEPEPPSAPVLEGDGALVYDFRWTLKGSAPSDTVVRLHLDDQCRGPSLRDFTSAELADGVALELVGGIPNVFTAMSIDSRGLVSPCSAAVRVSYVRPGLPRFQDVNLRPTPPVRDTHFVIRGTAHDAVTVQLFEGSDCFTAPIAELSPDAFREDGFPIEVEVNTTQAFVLQAINVIGQTSACSGVFYATSDQKPPLLDPKILSPMPSPERSAFIRVTGEGATGTIFDGQDCTGAVLTTCTGYNCSAFLVEFPMAASSSWSVIAEDPLGNRGGCVNSPERWEWDPLAPLPALELFLGPSPQFLHAKVPSSTTWVDIFDGSCDSNHFRARVSSTQLLSNGYYTGNLNVPSDGGVLVAQGLNVDLVTVYPCSNPVPWY